MFPWLVAFLLYQGTFLVRFVNWTSIVFASYINFVVPAVIFLKALDSSSGVGTARSTHTAASTTTAPTSLAGASGGLPQTDRAADPAAAAAAGASALLSINASGETAEQETTFDKDDVDDEEEEEEVKGGVAVDILLEADGNSGSSRNRSRSGGSGEGTRSSKKKQTSSRHRNRRGPLLDKRDDDDRAADGAEGTDEVTAGGYCESESSDASDSDVGGTVRTGRHERQQQHQQHQHDPEEKPADRRHRCRRCHRYRRHRRLHHHHHHHHHRPRADEQRQRNPNESMRRGGGDDDDDGATEIASSHEKGAVDVPIARPTVSAFSAAVASAHSPRYAAVAPEKNEAVQSLLTVGHRQQLRRRHRPSARDAAALFSSLERESRWLAYALIVVVVVLTTTVAAVDVYNLVVNKQDLTDI